MVYLTIIASLLIIAIVCIYYIYETNRCNKNNLKLNQIKDMIYNILMKDILHQKYKDTTDGIKYPSNYLSDYINCMKDLYRISGSKNIEDEHINKL